MSHRTISERTGIPVWTIRNYRQRPPKRVRRLLEGRVTCGACGGDRHDFSRLDAKSYSYLLGAYLGDGCISVGRSFQLNVSLDAAYPGIVSEVAAAVEAICGRPASYYEPTAASNCIHVLAGSKQWPCYFPQHGPGRKHERLIELVDWQRGLVDQAPEWFLRGLIHSDGCRTVNRFDTKLPSGRVATYEHPRYFFSNVSLDILTLFTEYCDALGVRWTRSNHRNISISHRKSVARLDEFVGPKV